MGSPAERSLRENPGVSRLQRINRYWFLLAPFALVILGLYVVPIGRVLLMGFTYPHPGLDNFARLAAT